MNQSIPLKPIVHYLLDILRVPPEDILVRVRYSWKSLFQLAIDEEVYYYLAAWSLEQWSNIMPAHLRMELKNILFDNKKRNLLLGLQIMHLAQVFKTAGIPILFLKGAAVLIRDLHPVDLRYLSDIDVLIPVQFVEKTRELLKSSGYLDKGERYSPRRHHIEPYYHPEYVAEIEIHIAPYSQSFGGSPAIQQIWHDADKLLFNKIEVNVPSITDHVWILMRTDTINRVFIPRPRDVIEIFSILKKENCIDFDLLTKRAEFENIPNIAKGMSYACFRYMGIEPFVPTDEPFLKDWEEWTLKHKQKVIKKSFYLPIRRHFAALRFLTFPGMKAKMLFLKWLFRNEPFKIKFFLLLSPVSNTGIIVKLRRVAKNIRTFLK